VPRCHTKQKAPRDEAGPETFASEALRPGQIVQSCRRTPGGRDPYSLLLCRCTSFAAKSYKMNIALRPPEGRGLQIRSVTTVTVARHRSSPSSSKMRLRLSRQNLLRLAPSDGPAHEVRGSDRNLGRVTMNEVLSFIAGKRVSAAAALSVVALGASALAAAASENPNGAPAACEGRWAWYNGRWGCWWINSSGVWTWYSLTPENPPYSYPDYPPYRFSYPPLGSSQPFGNMPAPQQYWYYCEAAKAYYPNVATCAQGWRAVPAAPESKSGSAGPPPGKP